MSLTKSAYQVLKKEIRKQKNLLFEVKFEQIPRIKNVGGNIANRNPRIVEAIESKHFANGSNLTSALTMNLMMNC